VKPVPGEELRGNSAVQHDAAVLSFPRFSVPAPSSLVQPLDAAFDLRGEGLLQRFHVLDQCIEIHRLHAFDALVVLIGFE